LFQDISIEELLEMQQKKELVLVDVRSPSEYRDATVPGSLNIPLFDDAERAEIGTLYKQVSVQAAKDKGLEIVSAKLPAFIKQFERTEGQKTVFCWRGGMRSKTTATVLSLMGIHVYRLSGGIRAYRKWVIDTLDHFEFQPRAYVINGNTGSGKTLILQRLKEKGYPILDFEGMASHRGSVFGEIGLESNNQKTFDSLLLQELLQINSSPFVLFEAESKRIGKVVLPKFIIDRKDSAVQLFIEVPIEERVRHILEDYRPIEHKQQCLKAFRQIKSRIHTPIAKEIEAQLQGDEFGEAVKLLLEHYYDPRYEHAAKQSEDNRINFKVRSVEEAVESIIDYLNADSVKP
jgi:tRNA 2-selenouridine synthase